MTRMQPDWTVAKARWWHMPGITRLIHQSRRRRAVPATVSREALIWAPFWSPSVGVVQSVWGARVPGVPTASSHVVECGGAIVGLGQCRPRHDPRQWEVTFLSLALDGSAGDVATLGFPDRRALHLLGRLCDTALERGGERVFALVRDEGDGYAALRQLSFAPVTRELTMVLPAGREAGAEGRSGLPVLDGLRRQERSDAFGVHELYRQVTPPVVQLAEARRPQWWELPRPRLGALPRLARASSGRRWVVVHEGRVVAWLHVAAARRGAHHLSLMVDPSVAGVVEPLVELGVAAARRVREAPVAASVRDHQWAERLGLEAAGFLPYEADLLMMKQLALTVPSARRQMAPALERVIS